MKDTKRRTRRPTKHAEILAALYLVYGGFHLLSLGPLLALSLGVLLSQGWPAWENELVSEGMTAGLVGIPALVVVPLVASVALWERRRCAKVFVALSAVFALTPSLVVAYVSLSESEAGWVLYFAPCLSLSVYSLWYVRRSPFP